jgi:hypothetical protein
MNKFSFQDNAAQKALDAAMKSGKAIVAIACGGGKTTVSQLIINKFIEINGKHSKILVITENNNALKDQYLSELNNAHIPINFTFGEITTDQNVQVRVGIAASLHKLPWKEIDIVLCDESHRHFQKERVQTFLKAIKVRHQILFTGTPAQFIKANESNSRKTEIVFISGSELQNRDLYAGIDLDVVRTTNKKDPIQSVKDLIAHSKSVRADLSKTLLVCPSINYAESVAQYLTSIGKTVFMSTSANDSDNKVLSESKHWSKTPDSETCFIVTVGKCSLGYNDAAVTTLADLRSSLGSLCTNQQVFARVLRRSPDSLRKFYFRISESDSKSYNAQVFMLHKLKAYMNEEIFSGFSGGNLTLELRRA